MRQTVNGKIETCETQVGYYLVQLLCECIGVLVQANLPARALFRQQLNNFNYCYIVQITLVCSLMGKISVCKLIFEILPEQNLIFQILHRMYF